LVPLPTKDVKTANRIRPTSRTIAMSAAFRLF
jgi:hypothetical protein